MPPGGRQHVDATRRLLLHPGVVAFGIPVVGSLIALAEFLLRKPDDFEWMLYGFHDKRWLVTLYFSWVVAFPACLSVAMARLLWTRARNAQSTLGPHVSSSADDSPGSDVAANAAPFFGSAVFRRVAFLVSVGLVWVLWGPPWGGGEMGGAVDYHESLHYKGLQAILRGAMPYVGAASDQYGPAAQLFSALWIKGIGAPTVIDIRVSWLALHFLALMFFVFVAFRFMETTAAIIGVVLAALVFPTWSFFQFVSEGVVGAWGWANVWRYAGLLLLGTAIPSIAMGYVGRRRNLWLFLVGCLWGVTCLFGQENVLGGLVLLVLFIFVLRFAGRLPWRSVATGLGLTVAGALALGLLYLVPYIASGNTIPFVRNYFLVPLAVAGGYSNTPWTEAGPWTTLFHISPFLVMGVGLILAVVQPPDSRDGRERRLVISWLTAMGVTFATAIALAGSHTRSDGTHFANTLVLFPFMIGAVSVYLAQRIGGPRRFRAMVVFAVGFALTLPFLLAFDFAQVRVSSVRERFRVAITARAIEAPSGPQAFSSALARRLGDQRTSGLAAALSSPGSPTPVEAEGFAAQLHALAGDKTVYIDAATQLSLGGHLGYWYFIADVVPFDVPYEEQSLTLTKSEVDQNREVATSAAHPPEVYVTADPGAGESPVIIRNMAPTTRSVVKLGELKLYVFVRRPPLPQP